MNKRTDAYLLVDGYNIIHSWDNLKKLAEDCLEDARDELIHILCDYAGYIDEQIIVVFDAHKVRSNSGAQYAYKNINIVFTKEAETADHFIEKAVSVFSRRYNVSVATSDHLEQIIILAHGAVRISARELQNQIKEAKNKLRKTYIEKPERKENLLFDHLSPETARFLEDFRRK